PERVVHDGVELLGIERAGELGGTLHVDEEDCDLLALAAEGAPLGQDALSQVTRGVCGRRRGRGDRPPCGSRRAYVERGAAGITEAGQWTLVLAAGGASRLDCGATSVAEPSARAKLLIAGGTVHAASARSVVAQRGGRRRGEDRVKDGVGGETDHLAHVFPGEALRLHLAEIPGL